MRIAYIANEGKPLRQKSSLPERRLERCTLMYSNQLIEDEKVADNLFADRLQKIKIKKLKLGL